MREVELRLALVCYGGISLAVYMHGITKEVWRLARASRAHHDGVDPAGGSQGAYRALLQEIESRLDLRLRVLPDIIAGASAGGINGIFLANAIASGATLEPLTDLWLEQADVEALIAKEAAPASRFSKLWAEPLVWMAASGADAAVEALDAGTRDEVRGKLRHFIRSRWFEPPFGGPPFTAMLLDALAAMRGGPAGPRLLPDGQPLDLFVTVTDFRGHPERLRLNSPSEIVETEHRLTFGFRQARGAERLAADAELAFAARATSSFPGAFPPFTVGELDGVLAARGEDWSGRDAFLARMLPRQAAAGVADSAVMIDGAVLANAPFRPAIEALAERPARREIDRRFVYIDPRPGHQFGLRGGGGDAPPSFFATILGAISEIPREQPIRDSLESIAARSERIARMRGVVADIRDEVETRIEGLFGTTLTLDWPTAARLAAWRKRAQAGAAKQSGFAFVAYDRLKLAGVVDAVAAMLARLPGDGSATRRSALRTLIADHAAAGDEAHRVTFLRSFDLAFRIRRLRLLARRLAEMEPAGGAAALAGFRDALFQALSRYLEVKRAGSHAGVGALIDGVRDDPAPLLSALAASYDLVRLDGETDALLADALGALGRPERRPLLLTYLGFPFYDVATLPLLQGEGLDEFDPVRVDRISPEDCRAIRQGGAEATLKGTRFNNFGAFFSRAYRENDYLWGRLHGAERLIDIVVSALPPGSGLGPGRIAAIRRDVFRAIVAEERERLTLIPGLFAELDRQLA